MQSLPSSPPRFFSSYVAELTFSLPSFAANYQQHVLVTTGHEEIWGEARQ